MRRPKPASPPASNNARMERNVLAAAGWMLALSLLLGWIPILGPLAAGFIGGRKAGAPSAALTAAILPALLAGALVWVLVYALPELGAIVATIFATASAIWLVIQMGLVLLGALIGGWSAGERARRGRPTV